MIKEIIITATISTLLGLVMIPGMGLSKSLLTESIHKYEEVSQTVDIPVKRIIIVDYTW